MHYLNEHKDFVFQELSILSERLANIKSVKSYVRQVFEIAEMMDFLEYNHIEKVIKPVNDPKKQRLRERRQMDGESLTADELIAWLDAAKADFLDHKLIYQDYLLLLLTLNLGDRKAESYALQWKHVDLENGYIYIVHSLKKSKKIGPTKSHKKSKVEIPKLLIPMLTKWKKQQQEELAQVNIEIGEEQFLFTYTDFQGHINQPLHSDYLNYRLKSINHRHPSLAHAYPHKLRHTFSSLAREGGATMAVISNALTHSDIDTTKTYVNTPDVIDLSAHDMFAKRMEKARRNSMTDGRVSR